MVHLHEYLNSKVQPSILVRYAFHLHQTYQDSSPGNENVLSHIF